MSDKARESSPSSEISWTSVLLWSSIIAGIAVAAAGVVVGVEHGVPRHEINCPSGSFADHCYVRPHSFEGSALVLVSVMLGLLIAITGFIAVKLSQAAAAGTRD